MVDKKKIQKLFGELKEEDVDLTMFTITNLTLKNEINSNMVYMALKPLFKVPCLQAGALTPSF